MVHCIVGNADGTVSSQEALWYTALSVMLTVQCHIPGGIVVHCIVGNADGTVSHPRRLGTLKCSLLY